MIHRISSHSLSDVTNVDQNKSLSNEVIIIDQNKSVSTNDSSNKRVNRKKLIILIVYSLQKKKGAHLNNIKFYEKI